AFPHKPILALRDSDSEQVLFHEALRNGATFVIPLPLDPQDCRTALQWISRECGFAPKITTVVAVAGVNGGSGATTVALNLAGAFAVAHRRQTLLIELALRMGTLATYLQLQPKFNIHHLIQNKDDFDINIVRHAIVEVTENLGLLAGPQQAIQSQG